MDRPHERILGTILVVLGVAILLFAFYQAFGMLGHLPSTTSAKGPQAQFAWSVNGFQLTLTDNSRGNGEPITSTYWSFADGNSTSAGNTSHTYARAGNYNVTLLVENRDGSVAQSWATVHVGSGSTGSGTGSPSLAPGGSVQSVLGGVFGGTLSGIARTSEMFIVLVVMWMVGASILKAGWNLITPKSETIQVRVKPRSLQVEPAGYSAMPSYPSPAAGAPGASAAPSSAGT